MEQSQSNSENHSNSIFIMKRLTSLLLMGLIFAATAAAQAVIKFDKTAIDFGTFAEAQPQTAIFTFTNTGTEPLVVHQAMTVCGCTVAEYTKNKVMPGKTGQVKVVYNGNGKPKGYFKKVVTIRTNASNAITRLYVEGNMTIKE